MHGMIRGTFQGPIRPARPLFAVVVAAVAFLTLILPETAGAFAVTGSQWTTDRFGQPCGPPSGAMWNPCHIGLTLEPSGIPNWSANVQAAANQWSITDPQLGQPDFVFDCCLGPGGQVDMQSQDLGGPDAYGNMLLGTTSWSYDMNGSMISATIQMNANPSIPWCTSNCPGGQQVTLAEAMTHELGHALGLAHPVSGPNGGAVMECVQTNGENTLVQPDDVNGALYLYSGHAVDFGYPGGSPC